MMIRIQINTREVIVVVNRAAATLSDMTPFWRDAFDHVIEPRVDDVFDSKGFGAWPPRKDSLPHPLLRKTDRLYNSLTQFGHNEMIWQPGADALIYGTSVKYGEFHDRGTSRIPPRSFLFYLTTPDFEDRLGQYCDQWLDNRFNAVA